MSIYAWHRAKPSSEGFICRVCSSSWTYFLQKGTDDTVKALKSVGSFSIFLQLMRPCGHNVFAEDELGHAVAIEPSTSSESN